MYAKASWVIVLSGVALFLWGLTMPLYSDEAKFRAQHLDLATKHTDEDRSLKYWEMREKLLTPSIPLQNYGLSLAIVGSLLAFAAHSHPAYKLLPRHPLMIALIGLLATGVGTGGYVGALFLDMARGEFPSWSDSLGIPFMGVGPLFIVQVLWASLHLVLVRGKWGELSDGRLRVGDWWLLLVGGVTALLLLWSFAVGDFWTVATAGVWLLFYAAIWRTRFVRKSSTAKL
jgi:hypothetical protein